MGVESAVFALPREAGLLDGGVERPLLEGKYLLELVLVQSPDQNR